MQHQEANIKIYFTRDYSIFKNIHGNRDLNENKIKRIISDIESGLDMLRYCPIIVDKDMRVVDGQHRLHVARTIKSNIWYVITETHSLHEIARINSNTERWSASDFLNCYSVQGNKDYKKLESFMEKYGFGISVSCRLLMYGEVISSGLNKAAKEAFEKGEFKVTEEEKSNKIAETVLLFNLHSGYKKRGFIEAISKLMAVGKCDFKELAKKFNASPDALPEMYAAKEYLKALEEIYNKGQHKRKVIY